MLETEMFSFFEMTPDLVCIAGKDGFFRKVNRAVMEKLGYSREELLSRPIESFIHPEDRELTAAKRETLLQGKALVNFQNRYLTKSGAAIWLQWTSTYLPEKEIVFAIAKDITENKKREKEIEERYHTFRHLATHFKTRAEEDRKYLAHELHEQVGQLAAVQKMNLVWLQQKMEGESDTVSEKLEEIVLLSDIMIKTIQRLSFSVSPNMMDDLGLQAAFEWKCSEFTRITGIPCRFTSACDEEKMSREVKIDFFRVCEEALDNVIEHADAAEVWVTVEGHDNKAAIIITDNGKGFDLKTVKPSGGFKNMQHLAVSINGKLILESDPGKGTKVTVIAEHG